MLLPTQEAIGSRVVVVVLLLLLLHHLQLLQLRLVLQHGDVLRLLWGRQGLRPVLLSHARHKAILHGEGGSCRRLQAQQGGWHSVERCGGLAKHGLHAGLLGRH